MTSHRPIHSSFTTERVFSAPVDMVYDAWTDPEAKAKWFIGPDSWTPIRRELGLEDGGEEMLLGRFEDGTETLYTARYHVIAPNDRLVYAYDMHIDGVHLSVSLATVSFEPQGDGTKMIYTEQAVYLLGEDGAASRRDGTAAQFDRLDAFLTSLDDKRRLTLTRQCDAPRDLVWEVWTDPKHVAAWWGPFGPDQTTCDIELKIGGLFAVMMSAPDGSEHPSRGVITELVPGKKLVIEGDAGAPDACGAGLPPRAVITILFEDADAGTRLTLDAVFPSAEAMEAAKRSGYATSWQETLQALDAFMAELASS